MMIEYRDKNANGAVLIFSPKDKDEVMRAVGSPNSNLSILRVPSDVDGDLLAMTVMVKIGTIEDALDKLGAQELDAQPIANPAGNIKPPTDPVVDVAVAVAADKALTGL